MGERIGKYAALIEDAGVASGCLGTANAFIGAKKPDIGNEEQRASY